MNHSSATEELFTPIKPFSTDECSQWPEGNVFEKNLWKECCFRHDLSYWMGGTRKERREADEDLLECVAKKGDPLNGALMWVGTRFGGRPHYSASYRWGYGWETERMYAPLTELEKASVQTELGNINDETVLKAIQKHQAMSSKQ